MNESTAVARDPIIISGNTGSNTNHGIEIRAASASVSNCWIGLAADGVSLLPNGGNGIHITQQVGHILACNHISY